MRGLRSRDFSKYLFVFGVILVIVGGVLYLHGPKRFLNYENEEIGSWNQKTDGLEQKEFVWWNPGTFSKYVENVTFYAKFHTSSVSEAEVTLIVLNDSQLELWKEKHVWHESIVYQKMSNNEVVSMSLLENTTHYFVLENRLNTTIDAVFSLGQVGFFLRFDYDVFVYYIPMIVTGTILCLFFREIALKALDETGLRLDNRYGQDKIRKWNEDAKTLRVEVYKNRKFLIKLLSFAFAAMLLLLFLYEFVTAYQISNAIGDYYRPEFGWIVYDYAIRLTVYGLILILPLWVVVIIIVVILEPFISRTVREKVRARIGIKHQTKKQFLIEKITYEKIQAKVKSWPVLSILIIPLLFLMTVYSLGFVGLMFYEYGFVAYATVLGIEAGFIYSTSFHETCEELQIGEYAARKSMKVGLVSFAALAIVAISLIALTVVASTSDSWITFLNETLLSPVSLLGPKQSLAFFDSQALSYIVTGITLPMIVWGVMSFVLFPVIYKKGRKRMTVALLTFALTYLTEVAFSILLGITAPLFQPFAVASPVVVALFSWILQGKYQQKIEKIVKPKAPKRSRNPL